MFEATAVEALLHISLGALRVVPAHLQQVVNIEDVERTQGVFGAGKSSAAHVHRQINTINP